MTPLYHYGKIIANFMVRNSRN